MRHWHNHLFVSLLAIQQRTNTRLSLSFTRKFQRHFVLCLKWPFLKFTAREGVTLFGIDSAAKQNTISYLPVPSHSIQCSTQFGFGLACDLTQVSTSDKALVDSLSFANCLIPTRQMTK